jgi:nicotinate-nucleotide pyrophosphorylase (carboxylating)
MFLIKENHIATAGNITAAVQRCRAYARVLRDQRKIEVETKNLGEVEECLQLGVDRILLDNMSLQEMRKAVTLVAGRIPLEASGNVNIETVRAIAETGVDFISIGALTHSAPAMDFSLLLMT